MRQRAASAAAGVAALSLGFGVTSIGTHRHAPAGTRSSVMELSRASVLSVDSQNESWAAELQALETQRLADEQVAREAAEEERVEQERQAEAERVASEKARKAALAAQAAKATSTTVRPVSTLPATTGTGACGGSLPPCSVMNRESGGNPRAYNPTGCYNKKDGTTGCYGKWQFMDATWHGLGYSGHAYDYSESVQDEGARTLWDNGSGCSHWGAC